MLHCGEIDWRLAQFEHERLVAAMRSTTGRSSRPRFWAISWRGWRWGRGQQVRVEMAMYLRSEWGRPFVPVERVPRPGSYDGLVAFVW